MQTSIGPIVLFGSGETSPRAQRIHHEVLRRLQLPVRVAIVETPAGFEPNSARVAQKIGDYLEHRLRNFQPSISVIPARRRHTPFSPDDPAIAGPIFEAGYLFMGPGSPTYAARQLAGSYTWHSMLARHHLGAALGFASAATIALSRCALPVYEIYKVGEDLHWKPGLDFFAQFGLNWVLIPHWNNQDGGAELDTSHCYLGKARFDEAAAMLPPDVTILGIEESTGLILLPAEGVCEVVGAGAVVTIMAGVERRLENGAVVPLETLGAWRLPEPGAGVPPAIWARAQTAQAAPDVEPDAAPPAVAELVAQREAARTAREWAVSDQLRQAILALGWQVIDTRDGPRLEKLPAGALTK